MQVDCACLDVKLSMNQTNASTMEKVYIPLPSHHPQHPVAEKDMINRLKMTDRN